MSKISRRNWDRLNAYVDGELSLEDAAHIAMAIANDPALAREVAALTRLKAASATALAISPTEVPRAAALRTGHVATPSTVGRPALAASFLLLIAAATVFGVFLMRHGPADELATWHERAEEHFNAWLTSGADKRTASGSSNLRLETSGVIGGVPDLSIARLQVAHMVAATARAPSGLFVGYVGARGCRLGLWIAPAPADLDAGPSFLPAAGELRAIWRAGGTGYKVLANGMNEARFHAVAEYLVHLTRKPGEAESLRMAANSQAMTAHCVG